MKARLPKGYGRPDPNAMMRQVQKMQDEIRAKQEELEAKEYTGTASGEMVTVTMTGKHEITAVKIKPERSGSRRYRNAGRPDRGCREQRRGGGRQGFRGRNGQADRRNEHSGSGLRGYTIMPQNVEPLENLVDQFARFPALDVRVPPGWPMK